MQSPVLEHERIRPPRLLRYPGGKGRLLGILSQFLPSREDIQGRYIDPFVGGAAVFLYMQPNRALLADINPELIGLFRVLRDCPLEVWEAYCRMPDDREGYYRIRGLAPSKLDEVTRAARLLYLSRTCFKGMWRHNRRGEFNIGYGGQSRRWVITREELIAVSKALNSCEFLCGDFETVLNMSNERDFVFVDPPYRPNARELRNAHYVGQEFSFSDQVRLAGGLRRSAARGVRWVMTNSAHPDIVNLYEGYTIVKMAKGTGERPGLLSDGAGEVVILSRERSAHPCSGVSVLTS